MGSVRRRLQSHEGRLRGYGGVGRVHQTKSSVGFVRAVFAGPEASRAAGRVAVVRREQRGGEAHRRGSDGVGIAPAPPRGGVTSRSAGRCCWRVGCRISSPRTRRTPRDKAMRQADDLLRGSSGAGPAAGTSFDGVFVVVPTRETNPRRESRPRSSANDQHTRVCSDRRRTNTCFARDRSSTSSTISDTAHPRREGLHSAFVDGAMRRRVDHARAWAWARWSTARRGGDARRAGDERRRRRRRQSGTHPRARRRRRRHRDPLRHLSARTSRTGGDTARVHRITASVDRRGRRSRGARRG